MKKETSDLPIGFGLDNIIIIIIIIIYFIAFRTKST